MKYEWLDEYLISLPGAEKDYKPEWAWFRYQVRGKLFAAVCSPGPEHKTYGGHDQSHRLIMQKLPKYVQKEILGD